jgi:hypothetical protein
VTVPPPAAPPSTVPASPSPSAPPTSPGRVVDGWTVLTETDGSLTYLRTFASLGGDAAVKVRVGRATLVSATPRPGYTVIVLQPALSRVVVQFVAGTRMSIVDAMWWNNAPWGEVTEVGG